MEVLVTGGTGEIGAGITRQLAAAGHDVTVFVRGETDAELPASVGTIRGDRTNYDEFERRMASESFDAVIDMLCFTTADAESAARTFGGRVDHYVFASSYAVYARPFETLPVRENAPRRPSVSDYGAGKADCEDRLLAAHERGDLPVTVIRPGSVYGEGGTIRHTFGWDTHYLDRIRRGKPIVVHGDGTGLYAVVHRDDVARAFVNAVGDERTLGETYHVAGEEWFTWNRYYRELARALDAPEPELVHVPTDALSAVVPDRTEALRTFFQYSTVFDTGKAREGLDFEYTVSFREGARRTYDWLASRDRIQDAEEFPFVDRLIEAWRDARAEFESAVVQ